MKTFGFWAAATLALALPGNAVAAANEACELHIWPANLFSAGSIGSVATKDSSGAADGAIQRVIVASSADTSQKYQDVLTKVLSKENQINEIRDADPVAKLNLPQGTNLIVHDAENYIFTKGRRSSQSNASCYYELSIDHIIFNRHPLYGKDIMTYFSFRNFGNDATVDKYHSKRFRRKIGKFSIEEDANSADAASRIRKAFLEGFLEFSKKFSK
jgi:hypothetical protein